MTAHSTYQLGRQSEVKENVHLLEIGGKLKQLDFHKADWCSVKSELGNIDWSTMEEVEPVIALKMFFELVLPGLERTVPKKVTHNKSRSCLKWTGKGGCFGRDWSKQNQEFSKLKPSARL